MAWHIFFIILLKEDASCVDNTNACIPVWIAREEAPNPMKLHPRIHHFALVGGLVFLQSDFVPARCAAPVSDDTTGAVAQAGAAKDLYALDLDKLFDIQVSTASKFSEKLREAPAVMSVVTRDELDRFGGLTLGEILNRVAGLTASVASFTDRSLVAANGDQTQINGGHILFLINGRPTREVLEGGLIGDLLEAFPVNILDRIEVIKGPGSVLYGSNAFSAVVNLITRKADHNEVILTGLGGAGGATATSGQVMFKRGDFSIVGAGQFHQKPVWNTPYQSAFFGLQNVDIPNRAAGGFLEMDYKGFTLMSAADEWTTEYSEGGAGVGRWRRGFADLGYHFKPTARWDMAFNLTYTRTTLNATQNIPFIDRDSHEMLAEWTNVIGLTDRDQLTVGALFNHIQGTENFFGVSPKLVISNGSRMGGALYAQLEHRLSPNWKLVAGAQANKIGDTKVDVGPRGGIVWTPASHWTVKALYSEAFRAPSLNETLLHYIAPPSIGGPNLIGNPNLLPEKVATFDIGPGYQGDRFLAYINYFRSKLTNDIVEANASTNGTYENLGSVTFQGIEAEGKYYVSKKLFLMGSVQYQRNVDQSGVRSVTPIPALGAKAGVSYEVAHRYSASLFDVYEGHVSGYSQAANPRTGAYHLLNSHLRYDLTRFLPWNSRAGAALVAHADNLTNKMVWLPDWKDFPGNTTFVNGGRTIYAGVEFSFNTD